MFSVRLVNADSYQAPPLPQLDPTYSEYRGAEIRHVPVIRVFGSTPVGEKTCLHIHGVFPYMYVPYTGGDDADRLAYRLAASLDQAINVSMGSASSTNQHVYKIQRVSGIPFYGYHKKEHQFFKVYFYNPAMIKKAADLLQNGSVLNQSLQPHEAHIPFIQQFMIDYNIYGMSLVNFKNVKYRKPTGQLPGVESSSQSSYEQIDDKEYLPSSVMRQSICELEVDALASDILNRKEISDKLELNPGIAAIWEEEKARRFQAGLRGGDSQLADPRSPARPPLQPTDGDIYQQQRLRQRLAFASQAEVSLPSANVNPSPYPLEIQDAHNLLNASRVENHTSQLSRLGAANFQSSKYIVDYDESLNPVTSGTPTSHQDLSFSSSILDADDALLVDMLTELARDNASEYTVDDDSVLGSQRTVIDEAKNDGNEDDEVTDLNLTTLQLDSLSSWEYIEQALTGSSNASQNAGETTNSPRVNDLSVYNVDTDGGSTDSDVAKLPQYDGAGDISPNVLKPEADNTKLCSIKKLTRKKLVDSAKITAISDHERNKFAQHEVTSSAGLVQNDASFEIELPPSFSDVLENEYNGIFNELFPQPAEVGTNFGSDLENLQSTVQIGMLTPHSEISEANDQCVVDEDIPFDTVLNGDPCFTESAVFDRSDLTELEDQYVSLLGSALLPDVCKDSVSESSEKCSTEVTASSSPPVGEKLTAETDNVIFDEGSGVTDRQESQGHACRSKQSDEIDESEKRTDGESERSPNNSDYNCNVMVTWEELQNLQFEEKQSSPKKYRKVNCAQIFDSLDSFLDERSRSKPKNSVTSPSGKGDFLEMLKREKQCDLEIVHHNPNRKTYAAKVKMDTTTICRNIPFNFYEFCKAKNGVTKQLWSDEGTCDQPRSIFGTDISFPSDIIPSHSQLVDLGPLDTPILDDARNTLPGAQYSNYVADKRASIVKSILTDFGVFTENDDPVDDGPKNNSYYSSRRSHSGVIYGWVNHKHGKYSRTNKFLSQHIHASDQVWVINKRKRGRQKRETSDDCNGYDCLLPAVLIQKVDPVTMFDRNELKKFRASEDEHDESESSRMYCENVRPESPKIQVNSSFEFTEDNSSTSKSVVDSTIVAGKRKRSFYRTVRELEIFNQSAKTEETDREGSSGSSEFTSSPSFFNEVPSYLPKLRTKEVNCTKQREAPLIIKRVFPRRKSNRLIEEGGSDFNLEENANDDIFEVVSKPISDIDDNNGNSDPQRTARVKVTLRKRIVNSKVQFEALPGKYPACSEMQEDSLSGNLRSDKSSVEMNSQSNNILKESCNGKGKNDTVDTELPINLYASTLPADSAKSSFEDVHNISGTIEGKYKTDRDKRYSVKGKLRKSQYQISSRRSLLPCSHSCTTLTGPRLKVQRMCDGDSANLRLNKSSSDKGQENKLINNLNESRAADDLVVHEIANSRDTRSRLKILLRKKINSKRFTNHFEAVPSLEMLSNYQSQKETMHEPTIVKLAKSKRRRRKFFQASRAIEKNGVKSLECSINGKTIVNLSESTGAFEHISNATLTADNRHPSVSNDDKDKGIETNNDAETVTGSSEVVMEERTEGCKTLAPPVNALSLDSMLSDYSETGEDMESLLMPDIEFDPKYNTFSKPEVSFEFHDFVNGDSAISLSPSREYAIDAITPEMPNCLFEEDSNSKQEEMANSTQTSEKRNANQSDEVPKLCLPDHRSLDVYDIDGISGSEDSSTDSTDVVKSTRFRATANVELNLRDNIPKPIVETNRRASEEAPLRDGDVKVINKNTRESQEAEDIELSVRSEHAEESVRTEGDNRCARSENTKEMQGTEDDEIELENVDTIPGKTIEGDAMQSQGSEDVTKNQGAEDANQSLGSRDAKENPTTEGAEQRLGDETSMEIQGSEDVEQSLNDEDAKQSGASENGVIQHQEIVNDAIESEESESANENQRSEDVEQSLESEGAEKNLVTENTKESGTAEMTLEFENETIEGTNEAHETEDAEQILRMEVPKENQPSGDTQKILEGEDTEKSSGSEDTKDIQGSEDSKQILKYQDDALQSGGNENLKESEGSDDAEQNQLAEETKQDRISEEAEQNQRTKDVNQSQRSEDPKQCQVSEEPTQSEESDVVEQCQLTEEAKQGQTSEDAEQNQKTKDVTQSQGSEDSEQCQVSEEPMQSQASDDAEHSQSIQRDAIHSQESVDAKQYRMKEKSREDKVSEDLEQSRGTECVNRTQEDGGESGGKGEDAKQGQKSEISQQSRECEESAEQSQMNRDAKQNQVYEEIKHYFESKNTKRNVRGKNSKENPVNKDINQRQGKEELVDCCKKVSIKLEKIDLKGLDLYLKNIKQDEKVACSSPSNEELANLPQQHDRLNNETNRTAEPAYFEKRVTRLSLINQESASMKNKVNRIMGNKVNLIPRNIVPTTNTLDEVEIAKHSSNATSRMVMNRTLNSSLTLINGRLANRCLNGGRKIQKRIVNAKINISSSRNGKAHQHDYKSEISLDNNSLRDKFAILRRSKRLQQVKVHEAFTEYKNKTQTIVLDSKLLVANTKYNEMHFVRLSKQQNFLLNLGLCTVHAKKLEWRPKPPATTAIQLKEPKVVLERLNPSLSTKYRLSNAVDKTATAHRRVHAQKVKIPAFDGPADDDPDGPDLDATVEQEEKRICVYKRTKPSEQRIVTVTPKKRKYVADEQMDSGSPSKRRNVSPGSSPKSPYRSPRRTSMLQSPGCPLRSYSPLNIVVTSPKVLKDSIESHVPRENDIPETSAGRSSTTCTTPRRKRSRLRENLLRERVSASPLQTTRENPNVGNISHRVGQLGELSEITTGDAMISGATDNSVDSIITVDRACKYSGDTVAGKGSSYVRKKLSFSIPQYKGHKAPSAAGEKFDGTEIIEKRSSSENESKESGDEIIHNDLSSAFTDSERNKLRNNEHRNNESLTRESIVREHEDDVDDEGENITEKTLTPVPSPSKDSQLAQKSSDHLANQEEAGEESDDEDQCNVTFTEYVDAQLNKHNLSISVERSQDRVETSHRAIVISPKFNPPSRRSIVESMGTYGISRHKHERPFFSNYADVRGQKEVAHRMLQVPCKSLLSLPAFKSNMENLTGLKLWRKMKVNEFHPSGAKLKSSNLKRCLAGHSSLTITPLLAPPTPRSVATWLRAKEYLKKKKEGKEDSTNCTEQDGNAASSSAKAHLPNASDSGAAKSNAPLTPNTVDSVSKSDLTRKVSWEVEANDVSAKAPSASKISSIQERKPMRTDDSQKSDKSNETDSSIDASLQRALRNSKLFKTGESSKSLEVSCGQIDYSISGGTGRGASAENLQNAKVLTTYQYLTLLCLEVHIATCGSLLPDPQRDSLKAIFYAVQNDVPPTSNLKPLEYGAIVVDPNFDSSNGKSGHMYGTGVTSPIFYTASEETLFNDLVSLINRTDPDILLGWEIESLSWGYVMQRASHIGLNLASSISRIPSTRRTWEAHSSESDNSPEIKLPGRIILDIWRLMRHEIALLSYSFENVMYHVMHERLPCPSFATLTSWWGHRLPRMRWMVASHYTTKVLGIFRLLDQLDIVGRTSELARLFGIQFYEVFSRGSQFRVESMMLRLAKPFNYVPVSPSVQQRAKMRAPEFVPLIMEPESEFYVDPLIVLDFQSLYPSIIIAYNYCFSTCLGRIEHIGQPHPFEFGASTLKVTKSTALSLDGKVNFAPCGVAYVKPEIRRGILPRMLSEILDTRLMVKKAMKDHPKSDRTLQRALHSRQLGLKLIANVTYGYTAANFSGRMPCIEIGDSVVSKGRETLERAIKIVESTPKWGARVVYGDTDSIFVLVPGKSRKEAFEIGVEIADVVTAANPKPVKLKFEKILHPSILQTKKRYCGFMYEHPDQDKPEYLAKGIETVRRDGCPAVSKILEKSLRILFDAKDVSLVKQYVTRQLDKILRGRVSIQDLIFAKEFRGMQGYRATACVPALELTRRLIQKDPRAVPRTSERVPYIIVAGAPNQPLIQCVRTPWELIADPGLKPNAVYYITRVIIPPLNRCLNLFGVDANTWFSEMPHRKTVGRLTAASASDNKQKTTISQYFGTVVCASCGQSSKKGVCHDCAKQPSRTLVILHEKIRRLERNYYNVTMICQSCTGRASNIDCASLDCPVLYSRAQARRELEEGSYLRDIIDDGRINSEVCNSNARQN